MQNLSKMMKKLDDMKKAFDFIEKKEIKENARRNKISSKKTPKRTRAECIDSGDWMKMTDWEKTEGQIAFSESELIQTFFGSIEDFVCWYNLERGKEYLGFKSEVVSI